jgi:hypothetical protein
VFYIDNLSLDLLEILIPNENELVIAGEKDTIIWETSAENINLLYSLDEGNSFTNIVSNYPADSLKYIWDVPEDLISAKSVIRIENTSNTTQKFDQPVRIKPYVLTRLDPNGDYVAYDPDIDQWGFSNIRADMWPIDWHSQFNYQGIDPFTGIQYSQSQANSIFSMTNSSRFSDWVSWVNTFGIDAFYISTFLGWYKPTAVIRWRSTGGNWGGSCFGIAAANALAFGYRNEFVTKYPNYPSFIDPISVVSDTGVKRVVNELYTHQFGNPSIANDNINGGKTASQTLDDLKALFKEDNASVKTLTIFNNGGGGGHTILAYGLKKDPNQDNIYYVQVYDNSYPNSNNPITINTTANNWSTPDWAGWGGNTGIYLEIVAAQYLNGAAFPRGQNTQSTFRLPENVLEIRNPNESQIRIVDNLGQVTGFVNNLVLKEITGSLPQFLKNGSVAPPYGYSLPTDNYSIVLNEFAEDTVSTFFFTDNKTYMYERNGATQTQTDRLFFDGGVSVVNPDEQTKTIKLLNLINETTQEKLTVMRSIELTQNDSVKIENPDSNKVKLISYGTAKNYDIELNYVTENGIGRFGDFNIQLKANTSHTFVPVWTDLTNSELQVLVDIGNDGSIDDTLSLINQVTGIGDDQGSLLSPNSYNLAQNYPNPFNPITTIQYSIPQRSSVTLKVYDILGKEVAALVNEEKDRGVHSVNFDASGLASGLYLYRLQAGSFVETKKMILLR